MYTSVIGNVVQQCECLLQFLPDMVHVDYIWQSEEDPHEKKKNTKRIEINCRVHIHHCCSLFCLSLGTTIVGAFSLQPRRICLRCHNIVFKCHNDSWHLERHITPLQGQNGKNKNTKYIHSAIVGWYGITAGWISANILPLKERPLK